MKTEANPKPDKDRARRAARAVYQQYLSRKRAYRYDEKPYALDNLSPAEKKTRALICGILAAVGIIGLVIADYYDDSAADALTSFSFWCGISSVLAWLFSGTLLLFGVVRAGIVTVVTAVAGALAVWLGYRLADVYRQSATRFFLLLGLLIVLIAAAVAGAVWYWRRRNALRTFTVYNRETDCVAADLELNDFLPSELPDGGYTRLIRGEVSLNPKRGVRAVNEVVARLAVWAKRKKLLFGGHILRVSDGQTLLLTFYLYATADTSGWLRKKLTAAGFAVRSVDCLEDAAWSAYREKLYPDTYTLHTIGNRNLSDYLEQNAYDFSQPLSLVYTLTFTSEQDAQNFVGAAEQAGYVRALVQPVTDQVTDDGLPEQDAYLVYVQNECRAGEEQLNVQTRRIMDFAADFHGTLADFDIGELTEEE